MIISVLKSENLQMIREWWEAAGITPPAEDMIPQTTFIASVEGTPYLAISLFITNTSIVWLDNLIGNPKVDKKLRAGLAPKLLEWVSAFSKKIGKSRLFCMSMKRSTDKYYGRLGFTPTVKVLAFTKEIR